MSFSKKNPAIIFCAELDMTLKVSAKCFNSKIGIGGPSEEYAVIGILIKFIISREAAEEDGIH